MQPLSAVVWQLLACAKPCCCYTWPACRYLRCPAWQLVDCVSVLVEQYVLTLINEDYYYYYYYYSQLCETFWHLLCATRDSQWTTVKMATEGSSFHTAMNTVKHWHTLTVYY